MIHDKAICKDCRYMKINSYSLRMRHCQKCNNYGEKLLEADVTVNQTPVSVSFTCPHCDEEVEIDYQEFEDLAGEPCDWNFSIINCPRCEKKIQIDSVDWQ